MSNLVNEVNIITITLASGDEIEQCVLRESGSGLYFSVDASYVEQDVDDVISPYNNGPLRFPEDSEIETGKAPLIINY